MVRRFLIVAIVFFWPLAVMAVQPEEVMSDPRLESRARALSANLRCLVCQNQSIDDSDAPLARDLRVLVRERLKEGDSDEEVSKFLVARYGEFILLKPPFNAQTILLWSLPGLILLLGGGAILYRTRRRRIAPTAPLSADEESQLRNILDRKAS